MRDRHVILLTYGEPPTPAFFEHLRYSWRILLGLTRSIAPIPRFLLPFLALYRAGLRNRMWRAETYSSPLEPLTESVARGLAAALVEGDSGSPWHVHVAYEFRKPLLSEILDSVPDADPVVIVPMYVADTAFTHDISRRTIEEWLATRGGRGADVRVLGALDTDTLAELSARHVLQRLTECGIRPGKDWALILAAHGTLLDPPRPMETGRMVTERLAAAIQSRLADQFGLVQIGWLNHQMGGRWTEPPAHVALERVVAAGISNVVYYPFGFFTDNAETELEGRIALRTQPRLEAVHLPCLNDSPELVRSLARHAIGAHGNA